jgi:predicted alpha-1,6-mannanase (GH76 family)
MTSKREQVINTLHNKLKILDSVTVKVYRNLDKPQKIPSGGIIILRDGASDEPEVLLSPVTYIYEQLVTLEVMVQNPDSATRDSALDTLLANIGSVINAYRTLDGLAEWVEARSPEFEEEPIEGAPSVRTATLQVMVRFYTTDPLN